MDDPPSSSCSSSSSLELVIRFSTAHPDLILPIAQPFTTSTLTLKQNIRSQLSSSDPSDSAATNKLRLIHSGKVLPGTASLGRSLNVTLPTTRPQQQQQVPQDADTPGAKSKGKLPIRDTPARLYIHCAIGDALTPAELTDEAKQAQEADEALLHHQSNPPSLTQPTHDTSEHASTTTPAPRGFDRLHSAGFTPAEVAALRTQFLAIQAHTHTPDTMPTGADLLALEEQWLDSGSGGGNMGGEDGAGGFGSEDAGGLEDMLYGNLIGFFWPLGAVCWLMREEGVWTRRRQIAVLSGFLVNLTFGFLRIMS